MNSIAIIIILMISLLGIGSIFWIRNYYNVNTRTVDKVLLKNSVTNILTSKPEEEYENINYSSSSLERENETNNYADTGSGLAIGSSISGGIKKIFNNDNRDESRLHSLKTAINGTIKKEDKNSNDIRPNNNGFTHPAFVNQTESEEEIVPYTQETGSESPVEKPPIFPKTETQETVGNGETEEDNGVIYTEHAIENKTFVSAEDEVQKAINKDSEYEIDTGVITPIHTSENNEILELYDDNETMTPYENFQYKDSDQRKIENASNKIDKFYERLSEISINKITGKNKEENTKEDESLNKNESIYTQTVFKTESDNNKLSNETIVPFNQNTSSNENKDVNTSTNLVASSRGSLDRRVDHITVKINNRDVELKNGDTIIFNYNNESYSSTIIDVRTNEVYVKYRRHCVWISPDAIKKKLE